ncbi:unnamed protein product [Adineta ricciae]|uniref:SPIN90/Ldb17 leucine-rich domain-containing protein n=1 Tax=Adineta ricciae TaxID=249248 RepID=A0A814CKT7_ADIRI|nr:unnamed protein product [Adineta ricciae]
MNNDEIVSDIISLIHSDTQSSYVICSKVSSKIFAYLSQLQFHENQWNELIAAAEHFDQNIDHPDLQQFRQLLATISHCANDCEERNYTLGRDRNTLFDSINQLRNLLKSHVDLRCVLLKKLIEQEEIQLHLIDLMNLTGMNVGNDIHGVLCDIVDLLCQIDSTFARTNVIDHPIVSNCVRIIQTNINSTGDDNSKSTVLPALSLLSTLLSTNESFPVHTNSQLTNASFVKSMFELIETNHEDEDLVCASIKFLLSFNLRFEYPHKNPLIKTLLSINEEISSRELIERLIFLFNRSIDPTEHKTVNSIIKLFQDLFDDGNTANDILLSDSNRRLIIEIISRELSNRSCADESTTAYLSLLELLLRSQTITPETCTRIDELQTTFRSYLSCETCLHQNRFIIAEIIGKHSCFSFE